MKIINEDEIRLTKDQMYNPDGPIDILKGPKVVPVNESYKVESKKLDESKDPEDFADDLYDIKSSIDNIIDLYSNAGHPIEDAEEIGLSEEDIEHLEEASELIYMVAAHL